jgi:hypothetical protein
VAQKGKVGSGVVSGETSVGLLVLCSLCVFGCISVVV